MEQIRIFYNEVMTKIIIFGEKIIMVILTSEENKRLTLKFTFHFSKKLLNQYINGWFSQKAFHPATKIF